VEGAKEGGKVGAELVEHHRERGPLPDVEAFLGGGAGLLEVRAREPLEKARGDDGVLQAPEAVRVGDHGVDVPGGFDDADNPLGVGAA
jgi:hypothetical protein